MRKTILAITILLVALYFTLETPDSTPTPALEEQKAEQVASLRTPPSPQPSPSIELERLDQGKLLKEEREQKKEGRHIFAKAREINITPATHGTWERSGDSSRWEFEIESPGAESLNFGFTEFHMPKGGTLSLRDAHQDAVAFQFGAKDNEEHGQLWTPIIRSERVAMLVEVPSSLEDQLRLKLSKVNHGFRNHQRSQKRKAIGDSTSNSCNIDVICSAADDSEFGPLVDMYRDQIRSVGAYTLNGIETCSGALINNTNQDSRPFFLTAFHCEVRAENAPSIVVYWNFENSDCRTPGSSASGANGNGSIQDFNTGSFYRAGSAASDFCLLELDDPVDPNFSPYFAGWDRTGIHATTAIAIHHPGVSEKRISFELDTTSTTDYYQNQSSSTGTHIRVADWDFGTTEGGSSGSPLFDQTGKIIGQLHGGDAACGNDLPDWYGRLSRSWSGDGTSETRLSDWLDPENTGASTLNGRNSDEILSIDDVNVTEADNGSQNITLTVTLDRPTEEEVSVTLISEDGTATIADNDYQPLNSTLTFQPGVTQLTTTLTIVNDNRPEENETIHIFLENAENAMLEIDEGAIVTILNDDFITPEITSPSTALGAVQETFRYQTTALNTPRIYQIENGQPGMTINDETGLLTWTPSSQGTFTVDLIAENPAGSDRLTISVEVQQSSLIPALDFVGEATFLKGNPGWAIQTEINHDGEDAAASDLITHDQSAEFTVTVDGPDVASFWWKVSSERNYDFLSASLDGVVIYEISGEVDWERLSITVPEGSHNITWSYRKDGSENSGSDRAWVDELELASVTGEPAITSPLREFTYTNEPFTYTLSSFSNNATFNVQTLPSGLSFDGTDTISGNLTDAGVHGVLLTAQIPGETSTAQLIITAADNLNDATETNDLLWKPDGNIFWSSQTSTSHDGSDAAQAGDINDNQISSTSLEVTGPDEIQFWWKVDSEKNFDFLSFTLDGSVVAHISGSTDWELVHLEIPSGRHTIGWHYVKDRSASEGADTGWIDQVSFLSSGLPFFRFPVESVVLTNQAFKIPFEILNNPSARGFDNLPDWLSYNQAEETISGITPSDGIFVVDAWAENSLGRTEVTLKIESITLNSDFPEAADHSPAILFDVSENNGWHIVTSSTTEGNTALESGAITHSQESTLRLLIRGPGRISFDWSVSSEDTYDLLELWLNGTSLGAISGEVNWTNYTLNLGPGLHEVEWNYFKDGTDEFPTGDDLGRIDNLRVEGFPAYLDEHSLNHLSTFSTDDLDGDDFDVFHEYALGGSPSNRNSPKGLQITRTSDFDLQFTGRTSPIDIIYEISRSTTLTPDSWDDIPQSPSTSPLRGDLSTYTLEDVSDGQQKSFFQVQAIEKTPGTE